MSKRFTNKYAGTCGCGRSVSAGAGFCEKGPAEGPKWITTCAPCVNGTEPTPETPADTRPTFPLTEEQEAAVALFLQGQSIAVQAGAGTGKTSTLVAIAKATSRTGQYVAFNSAIVKDAAAKMPSNVSAATAHSLAFRQVGKTYKARLDSKRQSSGEIARRLSIDPFMFTTGEERRVIQPDTLAGYVMKAIGTFCNTADKAPGTRHLPYVDGVDLPDGNGQRTYEVNDAIGAHLADAIDTAWADIVDPEGQLRFTHDNYLKIWELGIHGAPRIPGEFILFDEAQDASPVLLSAVEQQGKQVVFVGDAQQAIYEWRGAVDAMSTVPAEGTAYLTHSFRFGQGIADVANVVLGNIEGAVLRLTGRGAESTVGRSETPDAILTRTNAGAIAVVLGELETGRQPHLVGGAGDVERFAKAARDLQNGRPTDHPELSIFQTWGEVQAYVEADALGAELKAMVKLIDQYGVEAILTAVSNRVSEEDADVVVSTAHKSKGREWDTVRLHGDFPEDIASPSELRLLYVAITRAQKHLDIEGCAGAIGIVYPERAAANRR